MDLHQHYTDVDIEETAFAIGKVAHSYARTRSVRVPVVSIS
jgi:hypothetical protein